MQALLLCAGIGNRLKPLTDSLPKCLMPINGRPLLEYWFKLLLDQGVDEILVNTHHQSDKVEDYIRTSGFHSRVKTTYEHKLLNTAGTVLKNRDFFLNRAFFFAHADNLAHFSLREFISAHRERKKGTEITMMTFRTARPESCGIVELDHEGVVTGFFEKVKNPPGNLANGAVYIAEPNVIRFLEEFKKEEIDFSTEVLPKYVGKIQTFQNKIYHRDIGTFQSLLEAQIDYPITMERQKGSTLWEDPFEADFLSATQKIFSYLRGSEK